MCARPQRKTYEPQPENVIMTLKYQGRMNNGAGAGAEDGVAVGVEAGCRPNRRLLFVLYAYNTPQLCGR